MLTKDNMGRKYDSQIGVRIEEQDKNAIEEYAEERGMTMSTATRVLLYDGMRTHGLRPKEDEETNVLDRVRAYLNANDGKEQPYMRSAGQQGGLIGTIIGITLVALLTLIFVSIFGGV